MIVAVAVVALAAPRAMAWGFTGHRLVNARAVATLPAELRPLFEANADYLAEHSIDPDLWRQAGLPEEGPNHYLDLDAFGPYPFAEVPLSEAEHRARRGDAAADRGRVPWRVGEAYAELVGAFRARDAAAVLHDAAVLGHYVADAHVPLHAVLNYDGQLSGQTGLHARWESVLVERFERQLAARVEPAAAPRVDDPVAFTFGVLRESFTQAEGVLASDRACRGAHDLAETPRDDRYDDAYYSKMYEREEERLLARLTASAEGVGALWRGAWERAGRPALDAGFRFAHVRGRSRALLLSLDGASARVLDDAVARGAMPSLARLRRGGAVARGVVPPLPAKTAPGHAALFTGAWSDRNGVSANWQPLPGGSILEQESGFPSTALLAEPLWVTAARQGLRASVLSVPQSFPFAPYVEEKRFGGRFGRELTLVEGYQHRLVPDAVLGEHELRFGAPSGWPEPPPKHTGDLRELAFDVAGAGVAGLLFDDPDDPVAGFDTLLLRAAKDAKDGALLKALPPAADASAFGRLVLRFPQGRAAVFFRLFELASDGSRVRLYRSEPAVLKSNQPGVEAALVDETGGFVGNSAHRAYERGRLGPTLFAGGDGSAERRYLETAALCLQQFRRLAEFGRERTAWDVIFAYVPFPDDLLHVWLGALDPALPGHDPALAARLRPFLDRGLALVDDYVRDVTAGLGPDTIVAIAADHGQVAVDRRLSPNVALRDAGLVALDRAGRVDLTRTSALYFAGESGFLLLNRAARPGGIVRPQDEDAVVRRARDALLRVRGPDGRAVVVDVIDARGGGDLGLGGPHGGDLYLSLASGYELSAALDGPVVEAILPRGDHALDPRRPGMPYAFLLAGPGVAAGADLGTPRAIDIAPTLARLLGLDPPAHATGRAIDAALAAAPAR